MPMTRMLCAPWLALAGLAALGAGAAACTPNVEIRATQTCEGGNIEDCKNRCGSNEGMACYKLGWLHEEGQVVDHDFPRAKKLYEQACDANWAVACRALGDLYWKGDKVEQNQKKAIEYWQKACGLGIVAACPTETEIAVADGRLIMKVRANGSIQVTPNPKATAAPPPLSGAPPDSGGSSLPTGLPQQPSAPGAPSPPSVPSPPTGL